MQAKDKLAGFSDQEDMQTMDRKEEITDSFELREHGQKRRLVSQAKIDSQSPSILTKQSFTVGGSVSKQDYWSGLPFPSPGDLSNPGIMEEVRAKKWKQNLTEF